MFQKITYIYLIIWFQFLLRFLNRRVKNYASICWHDFIVEKFSVNLIVEEHFTKSWVECAGTGKELEKEEKETDLKKI